MITCDAVSVNAEDGTAILRDVQCEIDGHRTAIVGSNGSGKTTLARLFNGLVTPTHGTVTVDGIDVATDTRRVQRRVGFVFANADHQLVYPTPLEDVALSLRARGVGREEARGRAREQLERLGLADRADQAIHTLSGGEKHLAALAAVLVVEPDWLIIDEPTTTLDIPNRARVVNVLETLPQRLVVVTHDLELARIMGSAVLVHDGTVVDVGPSSSVIDRYLAQVGA